MQNDLALIFKIVRGWRLLSFANNNIYNQVQCGQPTPTLPKRPFPILVRYVVLLRLGLSKNWVRRRTMEHATAIRGNAFERKTFPENQLVIPPYSCARPLSCFSKGGTNISVIFQRQFRCNFFFHFSPKTRTVKWLSESSFHLPRRRKELPKLWREQLLLATWKGQPSLFMCSSNCKRSNEITFLFSPSRETHIQAHQEFISLTRRVQFYFRRTREPNLRRLIQFSIPILQGAHNHVQQFILVG